VAQSNVRFALLTSWPSSTLISRVIESTGDPPSQSVLSDVSPGEMGSNKRYVGGSFRGMVEPFPIL